MRKQKGDGPKLTPEAASVIKALYERTELNQAQIAAKLGGINQGRISEVINGHRFPDVPAAEDIGGFV